MPRDITLHLVRFYLQRWGVYIRNDKKLDRSSISIIGRMIDEGPGASQATSLILTDEPEGVSTIQLIYRGMPSELQDVLRVRYIENRRHEIARRVLNISMRSYRETISQAEGYVQGAMRYIENTLEK